MGTIFKGDVLERQNGDKYFVVQAIDSTFHLVNLDDGNRWNNSGLEFYTSPPHITYQQVEKTSFGKIKNHYSRDEFKFVNNKKEPVCCEAPEPQPYCGQVFEIKEIEVNEIDLERVISHTMLKIGEVKDTYTMVEKIAAGVFDYLIEKGVVEVE